MDGNFYLFTMHSSVQFCGIIQCFPQASWNTRKCLWRRNDRTMVLDRHTTVIGVPFPEPDFKLHRGWQHTPCELGMPLLLWGTWLKQGRKTWTRSCLIIGWQILATQTATDTCTGCKSLTAAVASVLWKQAQEQTQVWALSPQSWFVLEVWGWWLE